MTLPDPNQSKRRLDKSQYIHIEPVAGLSLWLKQEGFQSTGSIKEKPAEYMLRGHAKAGRLRAGSKIIVPSSGNTVVGAAALAARQNLSCVAVLDPRTNPSTLSELKHYGAVIDLVEQPDPAGNFLAARWTRAQELKAREPGIVILDQYGDPANPLSHEDTTAPELAAAFPSLDRVFIGVGTGGTVTGTARGLRKLGRATEITGVTPVGSTVFGGRAAPLHIPGIGGSFVPGNLDKTVLSDVVWVMESESIGICRWLARSFGILSGGSTGSAIAAAIRQHRRQAQSKGAIWVAISPDNGQKYLSTVYNDNWVKDRFDRYAIELGAASELRL